MVCKLLIIASILTQGLGRFFELPVWMPTNVAPAYIAYGTYSGNVEEWNSGTVPPSNSSTNSSTIPPFHLSTFIRFSTNNAAAVASAFDGMFERYYLGELGMQTEGTIDELHVSTNPQPRSVTRRLFEVPPDKWKYLEFDYSYWTPYREEWNQISNYDWERVYTNSLRLAHYADQYVTRAWLDGRGVHIFSDAPGHKTNSVAATWGGENLSKAMGDPGWVKFDLVEMAPTNTSVRYDDLVNMLPVYGGLEPDDLFYSKADERNAASRNAMRVWPDVWKTIRDYDVNSGDYNQTVADLFGSGEGSYRRVWHTNQLDSVLAESLGLDLARLSLTNHWTNETMRFDTKLVGTMNAMIADLDRRYDVAPGDELLEVHCADYECQNIVSIPVEIASAPSVIASDGSLSNVTATATESRATASVSNVVERKDGYSLLSTAARPAGGSTRYPSYYGEYAPLLSYPRIRFSGVRGLVGGGAHYQINLHGPTRTQIEEFLRSLADYILLIGAADGRAFSQPIYFRMQLSRFTPGAYVTYTPIEYSWTPPQNAEWKPISPWVDTYWYGTLSRPAFGMNYAGWKVFTNDWQAVTLAATAHKSYNCDSTVDDAAKVRDRVPKPEEELGSWPVSNVWRGATGDVLDQAKPHAGHTVIAIDYDARDTSESTDGKVHYYDRSYHTNVVERFTAFDAATASAAYEIPYIRQAILDRGNADVETVRQRFFHQNQPGFALMDPRWVRIDLLSQAGQVAAFRNPNDARLVHTVVTNFNAQMSGAVLFTPTPARWRSVGDGGVIDDNFGVDQGCVVFRYGPFAYDDEADEVSGSQMPAAVFRFDDGSEIHASQGGAACQQTADENQWDYDHYDLVEFVGDLSLYADIEVDPPVSIDCRQSTLVEKDFIFHNLTRKNSNGE